MKTNSADQKAGVRTLLKSGNRAIRYAVEATGSASGLELALGVMRARRWFSSTVAGAHQVSLAPLVINEINVIGSRCGRSRYPEARNAASRLRR
jgi:threonine dehydrogenase-like Zn-dependent dehydrogenase